MRQEQINGEGEEADRKRDGGRKENWKGQTLKKKRGESIECEEKEITIENNVDSLETLREKNHLFTLSVRI